jgi:hypothetical protein
VTVLGYISVIVEKLIRIISGAGKNLFDRVVSS